MKATRLAVLGVLLSSGIAQEGEFSPAQFSLPRVASLSAKFKF